MEKQMSFYFNQPKELRTSVDAEGCIWFVAKDVCTLLGLDQVTNALKGLDDDEAALTKVKVRSEDGTEQMREVNIINEPGLYKLIFRSNKPQAKVFTRWVTHEVLPSIRKTGGYGRKYKVIGRNGRKLIDVAPMHLDLIEKIKSRMLYGEVSLMARELGISRDRVKNYLGGMVQKPHLPTLQRMQQWVENRRGPLSNELNQVLI